MDDQRATGYVWVVEYDDQFVKPQRAVAHEIRLQAGRSAAELERLMLDEVMPAQAQFSTRVGGVARQTLLKRVDGWDGMSGFPGNDRIEAVRKRLGESGVDVTTTRLIVIPERETPETA